MNHYYFQTEDFALTDSGLHLLRNGFNYKTLAYEEIENATIKKTTEIKNATMVLVFGLLLIGFGIYQSLWVVELFTNPKFHHVYIESIVLPVLPLFLGLYCLFVSLRRRPVLIVKRHKFSYKLRLVEIVKNKQEVDLELFLRKKLEFRFSVQSTAGKG